MSTGWIEAVMRLNEAIVEAEVAFDAQVITLVAAAERGQRTSEAEQLLQARKRKVALLRIMQDHLLRESQNTA